MSAFIVTLGTLSIGRGAGIWITKTRAMNLPEVKPSKACTKPLSRTYTLGVLTKRLLDCFAQGCKRRTSNKSHNRSI